MCFGFVAFNSEKQEIRNPFLSNLQGPLSVKNRGNLFSGCGDLWFFGYLCTFGLEFSKTFFKCAKCYLSFS